MAPHLQDQAKLFLDNIGVKQPKTIYNNKKLAPRIKQYVIDHIQNLDKLLANLEQGKITIVRAKSQFGQAGIKIVEYICDANSCHPDISKVLKILDWPKCTNTTSAWPSLGVRVYYRI